MSPAALRAYAQSMGGLLVRESLIVRSLRWLKLLSVEDRPMLEDVNAGVDYGQAFSQAPGFPPIDSLSAIAVDPWIYAAAKTVALDMAGLPIKVRKGEATDPNALVYDTHPVLDLLRYPSTKIPAPLFHAQLWIDMLLSGTWFALKVRGAGGKTTSLLRLHPERCRLLSDKAGQVDALEYEAGDDRIRYAYDDFLYASLPSWEEGPLGLFGTGAIRALKDDIEASIQLKKRTKETARKGRPDFLGTPKTPEVAPTATTRTALQQELNRRMRDVDGGIFITPPDFDFTELSATMKDLQGAEQMDRIRSSIMAVLHVPPIKLGLETANYATSNNQLVEYWTHYLLVSCIPAWQFSRLAKELGGPTDEVYYDGSGIDAFQEMRTSRLARIGQHVSYGMTVTDAYAYEGLADAPIEEMQVVSQDTALNGAQLTAAVQIISDVSSGLIPRESGIALLVSAGIAENQEEALAIMSNAGAGFVPAVPASEGQPAAPAVPAAPKAGAGASSIKGWFTQPSPLVVYKAPDGLEERDKAWHEWATKTATPAEGVLTFVVARMLKAQRIRIQKRLATVLHREGLKATGTDGVTVKAVQEDIIAEIMSNPSEVEQLTKDMSPGLRRIIELAFKRTRAQIGMSDLDFDPGQAEHDNFAQKMAEQIQKLTEEGVRDIVSKGLEDGATISEMQKDLTQAYAFSPSRARAIARTESTNALNAGAVQAMTQAEAEGIVFRGKMWLSSRDDAVRDTHVTLDGQVVPLDGFWESSGAKAAHPGGFGVPSEDIACRCTVVPVLD